MKTKDQIIEERRLRRLAKKNANELESLIEKNPKNRAINSTIRKTGVSISTELSYCRHLFNILFPNNKPEELEKWNAIAEKAKEKNKQ